MRILAYTNEVADDDEANLSLHHLSFAILRAAGKLADPIKQVEAIKHAKHHDRKTTVCD